MPTDRLTGLMFRLCRFTGVLGLTANMEEPRYHLRPICATLSAN